MKSILKYTTILVVAMVMSFSASAQKIGYVDSGSLLTMMPKVKEAESNLETLGKQLQAKGQKMMQDFKVKYQDLESRAQSGDIAPKDQEAQVALLKEEENKILQFEQEMQAQIAAKGEELIAPILSGVRTAMQTVAKDNGYSYIFDGSPGVGVVLYADEATNVTGLVKTKLGLL